MNIIESGPSRNHSTHKKETIVTPAGFEQLVAIRGKDNVTAGHSGQSTLRMSHVLQSHTASQTRAQSGQKRQILKILQNQNQQAHRSRPLNLPHVTESQIMRKAQFQNSAASTTISMGGPGGGSGTVSGTGSQMNVRNRGASGVHHVHNGAGG